MPISKQIKSHIEKGSQIRKLFEEGAKIRAEGKVVYDLSLGNPVLEPPEQFKTSLKSAANLDDANIHRYMSNAGYEETRSAVAQSLNDDHKHEFTSKNIVMTVGAAGAVNVALKSILDVDEEVIVVAPYFVEYGFYIDNHGGKMVIVESLPNFDLDLEAVEKKITKNTRAIIITNPGNPTGFLYPQSSLNKLGELLKEKSEKQGRPIFLIDDAPYRNLIFDQERCTSCFDAYSNTMLATSHSKDLGIPGERIGFLAISPAIKNCEKLFDAACFSNRILGFVNAPALMQRVCTSLQQVRVNIEQYKEFRDYLYNELTNIGYSVEKPGGSFYMFPQVPGGGDDVEFVNLLKQEGLLTVPGVAFGRKNHFRIAYCTDKNTLEASVNILRKIFMNN